MPNITRIDVQVTTARTGTGTSIPGIGDEGAGTDGDVYVGIAGREFAINSDSGNFESADDKVYTLGDGGNVLNRRYNDPRTPQLVTDDLSKFPVYLRFEPKGSNPDWNVERIRVTVNPGNSEIKFDNARLIGSPDLWLGQRMGKFIYLSRS